MENTLGKAMPKDWKSPYKLADGQVDPYKISDCTKLFGHYEFLSLESAAMNYEGVRSAAEEAADDPTIRKQ